MDSSLVDRKSRDWFLPQPKLWDLRLTILRSSDLESQDRSRRTSLLRDGWLNDFHTRDIRRVPYSGFCQRSTSETQMLQRTVVFSVVCLEMLLIARPGQLSTSSAVPSPTGHHSGSQGSFCVRKKETPAATAHRSHGRTCWPTPVSLEMIPPSLDNRGSSIRSTSSTSAASVANFLRR